ncbi:putative knottin, scorpion toxin [Lupinus albus]|uniref:Putative knottin, scorpion toxin n=1 Tax=Lupinus albus TaxID=3870 RepID=A0A6A4QWN6_LUPAL|nr:putative knottin, scorpion toxin [Lupinus albus]
MASRTYQLFLIGIICIALIVTSGPTMVKAIEAYVCKFPCFGGILKESICNKSCLKDGTKRGGTCRDNVCCCRLDE